MNNSSTIILDTGPIQMRSRSSRRLPISPRLAAKMRAPTLKQQPRGHTTHFTSWGDGGKSASFQWLLRIHVDSISSGGNTAWFRNTLFKAQEIGVLRMYLSPSHKHHWFHLHFTLFGKAANTHIDLSQPGHLFYYMHSSGKRHRRLKTHSTRPEDSFFPCIVSLLYGLSMSSEWMFISYRTSIRPFGPLYTPPFNYGWYIRLNHHVSLVPFYYLSWRDVCDGDYPSRNLRTVLAKTVRLSTSCGESPWRDLWDPEGDTIYILLFYFYAAANIFLEGFEYFLKRLSKMNDNGGSSPGNNICSCRLQMFQRCPWLH